jgi:hypothetical protein
MFDDFILVQIEEFMPEWMEELTNEEIEEIFGQT